MGFNGEIEVLPSWVAVQRRPSLYLGQLRSLEATESYVLGAGCIALFCCDLQEVRLYAGEGWFEIEFHGDPAVLLSRARPDDAELLAEVILSVLYACADAHGVAEAHRDSLCRDGATLAVVNALAHELVLELRTETETWRHRRVDGAAVVPLSRTGAGGEPGGRFRVRPGSEYIDGGVGPLSIGLRRIERELLRLKPDLRVSLVAM